MSRSIDKSVPFFLPFVYSIVLAHVCHGLSALIVLSGDVRHLYGTM